ncbi:MAG: ATP-binding protein [Acidobacteriota bacterium]|jgi:hypothetical protein
MQPYEKLGAFYLGRLVDTGSWTTRPDVLLYDSRDLTTHGVCLGMTGSGKTGLCLGLIEEAAIDGIPVLAIDPKGDLGNLILTFPELRPEDFRPWVDPAEAARQGLSPDEYAARTAQRWREGLAQWDQDGERIARLAAAADVAIYTPGSGAGLRVNVLRSFSAPAQEVLDDEEALRERVSATVSGLLGLLGLDADPVRSREHILLANLLERAWRGGRDADVGSLIRAIQTPPFERVGVLDVETFFPARERMALALSLNNLLASPGFAAWLEGEPLEVPRLLWTPDGQPRVSILSVAHLSDSERMFFVTLLLNEVVAWMRGQAGTTSLRALLYMDEVFGFLPPVANPPSKLPLLTLLKQARAFGLGVMLATQNPVDLDYKALSNAGTWFLGRLQTERDVARVLDGLQGAAAATGAGFDRAGMQALLAGLRKRMFVMHNVHEREPVVFETRWAMSYLAGPLTRAQIQTLMAPRKEGRRAAADAAGAPRPAPRPAPTRPVLPPEAAESTVRPARLGGVGGSALYRPALYGLARVRFADRAAELDLWQEVRCLALLDEEAAEQPWEGASLVDRELPLERGAPGDGELAAVPPAALRASSYPRWGKELADFLYRRHALRLYRSPTVKLVARADEGRGEFIARLRLVLREMRDKELAKLQARYAPRLAGLQERIRRAEERVRREEVQLKQQKVQTAISVGTTVLGALFGRKAISASTVGRATTAARGVGRAAREREDVERALEEKARLEAELASLEAEFEGEAARLKDPLEDLDRLVEEVEIRPRKTDITVLRLQLVWTPWAPPVSGSLEPLF